ncbi:hypothetical protein HAX54_039942 [Datura stramonium]|uniref:ATP-dependent RNA helicase Ski2/MTR4 C-terminal domain-containing protein n=1 Tax=Datura stramonium TaxID=4076 RepID=A0ABS8VQS2_DATST|nr:hypothetical protein [Datura stramonium]
MSGRSAMLYMKVEHWIIIHTLFPGELGAAIRGENELWLAMVLRNKLLLDLKPAQLAATYWKNKTSLLELQEKHGVNPIHWHGEAWASGLTWKEIMMDCAMDEGDGLASTEDD